MVEDKGSHMQLINDCLISYVNIGMLISIGYKKHLTTNAKDTKR